MFSKFAGRLILALLVTTPAWSAPYQPAVQAAVSRISALEPSKDAVNTGDDSTIPGSVQPGPSPAAVTVSTYPFSSATGVALEDMSVGTNTLVAANLDDTASAVTNIGFDFWYDGVRFTQFSVNANGLMRLGGTAVSTAFDNSTGFATTTNAPKIAPYFDDMWLGTNGKVHNKIVGTAPNRKLVVEWLNETIPRAGSGGVPGAGTFQAWLNEGSGIIQYVYGNGIITNSAEGGYTIGLQSGAATNLASVSAAATTVSYVTANNTQSDAIAAGTSFLFTPNVPLAPSGLNFTGTTPLSTTLNWTDNSTDEFGFVVYRSTDGGTTYSVVAQTAANAITFADSGLVPSTNYFYQVRAVSEGALSAPVTNSVTTSAPGNIASTAVGGLWSDTATWVGGVVPVNSDIVTISNGATVTVDTAAVALSLAVGTGGAPTTLTFDSAVARTLTVGTSVTVASNGVLIGPASGTVTTHVLSVGANLTNDGVLDLSTNADTAAVGLTFTGAASNSFSGSGTTTDIRTITVNKGTSNANVIDVSASNFTVRGLTTDVAGYLTLTNGTFKLSGTFPGTNRVFTTAGYTIGATTGFWMNNPNYAVAAQNASPTVSGLFQMSQGTFNIGTATGNSMGFNAGSRIIVEGGAITSASRFGVASSANAITYTQTGGTITVNTAGNTSTTLGNFDLGTGAASSITISGGTIVVQLASTAASGPRDYRNQAGAGGAGVTAGTLQLGNAASGAAKAFNIAGVLPDLVVDNTSAGHSATFLAPAGFNNTSREITIKSGATLNIGSNVFLFNGVTLTNNGTLTGNGAGSRFIFFRPATANLYTGTGVVTAPFTSLELQNDIGLTIDLASPNIVVGRVILFSGGITNANKLTLGNGGTTTGIIQIGNTTTPTNAGTFDVPMTFNLGSGGQTISYLRTGASRTTGGEVNPARTLTTMTFDDNDPTHTLTLSGGDLTVTGTTNLTNGRIITGANAMISNGTVARTAGYVDGNYRKPFATAVSKTFEVGTANGYSPVVFNATAGVPADVTVTAVQSPAPTISPVSKAINRYWHITATGVTANLTFNYLDLDIPGTATEANLLLFRRDGAVFTDLVGTIDTALNTAAVSGITTFDDFTLSEAGAISSVEADLSITKTDGVTTVNTGGSLTYTIVASNAGPTTATGATVADTFQAELTCTWTCVGAGGGTCTAAGAGNINDSVNLPTGGSVTYTASCGVATVSASATIDNTATVTAPGGVSDPNLANNTANDTDTLVRLLDASITKTDGVTSAVPGTQVTYAIGVANAGPNDATVTTTDTLPANLQSCTWSCSPTNGTCAASGVGSISDAGTISAGGSLAYTLICTVNPAATGSVANTATVSVGAGQSDTNSGNNSATDTDTLTPQADVALSITDNREFVQVGNSLNYIITVSNASGPSTASATVTDALPVELSSGSWVCIPFGGASCGAGFGNTLSDVATLPTGTQVSYVYSATVQPGSPDDLITNSASVVSAGDTNPGNDSATDTPEDIIVIFKNGFESAPVTVIDGFDASDFVTAQLRINPALLQGLGIAPRAIAMGESADGKQLFTIELARFNQDLVLRTVLNDAKGLSERGSWQTLNLGSQLLTFAWQSASSEGADGYLNVTDGSTPWLSAGRAETGHLVRLRVTTENDLPWLTR